MFGTSNYPSKENILARISEIEIFRKYLGIYVEEDSFFCNPMRIDNTPTCNFSRKGGDGRLRMKDHAGYFKGDCIDLVMTLNRVGYDSALKIIWDDFNANTVTAVYGLDAIASLQGYHVQQDTKFHVKKRAWDANNYQYWKEYFIPMSILDKYRVFPVEILWVGAHTYKQNIRYRWDPSDPAYGYLIGPGKWKIYFPKRTKQRFLSNTNKLQGVDQLKNADDFIVITKSLKDTMVLDIFDVPSVSPHSEGIIIKDLAEMVAYYDKVYVFFDNDIPGRRGIIRYKQLGAIPMMFPVSYNHDYGIKDISDYIKFFKYNNTKQLIDDYRETASSGG